MKTPLESAAIKYSYGTERDFKENPNQFDCSLRVAFIDGATYQAPITREETIESVVKLLKESYPKENDGPYRSGEWFADWLSEQLKKGDV